jgi:hypothetical protein
LNLFSSFHRDAVLPLHVRNRLAWWQAVSTSPGGVIPFPSHLHCTGILNPHFSYF